MKEDRRKRMGELVAQRQSMTMEQLVEYFGVSMNTVRADVAYLVKTGAVEKIYGGVRAAEHKQVPLFASRAMENTATRTVGYTLLDRNGHMNNTRYLDWVDDLLSSGFHAENSPKEFAICYFNEALEDQEIALNWALTEDTCLHVDAHRVSDEKSGVFSATVQF